MNPNTLSTTAPSTSARSSLKLNTAQGVLTAVAFSLLLAGTNATTPLLPIYREALGFSPLMLSLTFVCYVGVLIVVLLLAARAAFIRRAPLLIVCAIVIAAVSDLLLATASEAGILAGRALAGISGGLGTGAAAALVVAALGARGRALSATGNLAGAVVGTSYSQICVYYLVDHAMHWTFVFHAIACVIVAAALAPVLWIRRDTNQKLLSGMPYETGNVFSVLRANKPAFLLGSLAWLILSSCIVLLPSFFAQQGMASLRIWALILFLASSALAQIFYEVFRRLVPSTTGFGLISIGCSLALLAIFWQMQLAALIGLCLAGAGIGIAYKLCLISLTRTASPSRQGALSSLYAAVTYFAAASGVLISGLLGNFAGITMTVFIWFGMLIVLSTASSFRRAH